MTSPQRVLVVCAHTDDETLGCGATLRRHVDEGDEVFCVSLTDGVGSRAVADHADARRRLAAANESARILGFKWFANGDFPDNAMDGIPLVEVVRFIETAKKQVRPRLVYTHHGGDLNVDHRIAFQAALTAFRPQPGETCEEILSFEVPSSTEWSHASIGPAFQPNLFMDVQATWAAKQAALAAYAEEMRSFPHARSDKALDALATWRGAVVGLSRAEAFEVVRSIRRAPGS